MKNCSTLFKFSVTIIFIIAFVFNGFSQTIIFTESIGTVGATTTIAAHETANGFDNDAYIMTSGGATTPADIRATSTSSGYAGASGAANVFFTTTSGQYGFAIEGIDASSCSSLTLDFAVRKETASGTAFAAFALDYWDGSAYQSVALSGLPTSASAAGWYLITGIPLPAGAQINGLKLRFTKTGTISCRLDDIKLKGTCGAPSPSITTSTSSLSSFTYVVGSGPSAVQSFTTSGSNLTNDIILNAPTNFEISTSSGAGFGSSLTLTQAAGSVASTPIFVRLISGLAVNTYTGNVSLTSTGATSLTVALSGSVVGSSATDIITANGESATVSSLINTSGPLTSVQGTQVWQFTIRDGGGSNDGDNLPSILNSLTFSRAAGDQIGDWTQTIQAIDLFDGTTNVGSGTITSNTVVFSGLSISTPDNGNKTISVRLTLKCPLGAGALDGDDFGFQISNGNVVFSSAGSNKTTFAAISSANGQNAINVIATQLTFIQQPSSTALNNTMSPSVVVAATDVCGNIDRDFVSNIDIISTGTMSGSPISVTAVTGSSTYSSVIHTIVGTGLTLTASTGSLPNTVSNTFDISAVTVFGQGDIAIVGMCVNMGACGGASGEDEISFVTFEDIVPGTSIDLTDNGFERVGCGSNTWGDGEGVIRITRTTSTLPKGSVITLRLMNNTVFVPLQPDANWTVSYPVGSSFNLNGNDEQVYIMQGGVWNNPGGASDATYTGGTLMFAINTYNAWTCNDNTTTRGDLPAPLKCFSIMPGIATINIKYTGPVTPASQKDWVDRLNSVTNWTGSSTCATYTSQGLDYGGSPQMYSIIASGFNSGQWTGASNTDWFDCNNWQNFKIPDATTNVVIDQTAINSCEVGVTAGNAVCSTINVNSNSATVRNLSVINSSSLSVGSNVAVTKTIVSAPLSLSVLNTATFTCANLTLTGTGSGLEDAQFNNKQNTSAVTINGNLTLNPGAKLDLTDAANYGIVNLGGNYTNNGLESDFKQANSVVKFNGTAVQSITTAGFNEVFGNIQINKSAGTLNLNNHVEIENVATYTLGLINSSASALLIFRDGSSHNSVSNSSFTNGPVRKIGNDAFTFPVGKTAIYAPAAISAPALITDHFTAEYFDINPHPTYDNTLKDLTIDHISICEYWMINRTNGNSNVTVNLSWDTPRSCGVTNLPDMLVARWDGSMWKDHDNGGTTGNTTTGTVVTAGAVTSFSPFTLGSKTVSNPLPVQLLNFEVVKNNKNADLIWSTTSEINNKQFDLMRSLDGSTFEKIGEVPAAVGHSRLTNNYYFTDNNTAQGINYYQLKQIDFNGTTTSSEIKSVFFGNDAGLLVYPNPVMQGDDLKIILPSTIANQMVEISIVDQLSKNIELTTKTLENESTLIVNTADLAKGIYTVKIKMQDQVISQRIIVM